MSANDDVQVLQDAIRITIGEIHTSMPGKIINFNPSTCRATIKPMLRYHMADGDVIDYPVIIECPVFMPKAGNARITYPVKAGDGCIIIFSERSLDEWLNMGSEDNHDPRQYDLTDAYCLVGLEPIQNISTDNIELINSGTLVSVTPQNEVNIIGNVNIKGNVNVDGNYTCSGKSRMNGSITCDGDVTASGISLNSHTHGCPHGGTTSGPN